MSADDDPQAQPERKRLYHCHYCNACGDVRVCLGCSCVYYCNEECQRRDWPLHRIWCRTHCKQAKFASEQQELATMRNNRPSYLSSSSSSSSDAVSLSQIKSKRFGSLTTEQLLARPSTNDTEAVFGVPFTTGLSRSARISPDLPDIITVCLAVVASRGLHEEGVFRISGSRREIAELRYQFQTGECPEPDDISDVHVATGLLKLYLRELPQPLFATAEEGDGDSLDGDSSGNTQHRSEHYGERWRSKNYDGDPYRLAVEGVPLPARRALALLFRVLGYVVENAGETKMDAGNLSIVFSPTLRAPSDVVNQCILRSGELFLDTEFPRLPREWPNINSGSRVDGFRDRLEDEEGELEVVDMDEDYVGETPEPQPECRVNVSKKPSYLKGNK